MSVSPSSAAVTIDDVSGSSSRATLAADVRKGLTQPFKELQPKYFYDGVGALLFDQICELPEYYPTRTEAAILRAEARFIAGLTSAAELVELGSGTAEKTRILIDELHQAGCLKRYVPFDVTEGMLRRVAVSLNADYPDLTVYGVIGDFERDLARIPAAEGRRVVAFLGGTIGNFAPGPRQQFMTEIADLLGPEDSLLIGHDLVKVPAVIEAAYNDSAGITAAFNRNILAVINRELRADFQPEFFEHVAFYDRENEWIEMRLRASKDMVVRIESLDLEVAFPRNEEIRTEISAKFSRKRLLEDFTVVGLDLQHLLTDPEELYGISVSRLA